MAAKQTLTGRSWVYVVGAVLAAGLAWWLIPGPDRLVSVELPALSPVAEAGQKAFQANCAQCHGQNGEGTDQGPPLIHPIYRPGHHADAAFMLAARRGVAQHHWNFGDMPPQPQVGDRSLEQIIRFVREVQIANGIQ